MTFRRVRFILSSGLIAIGPLCSITLVMIACGSGTAAPAATHDKASAVVTTTPYTASPQEKKPEAKVDCDAVHAATIHFGLSLDQMVNFRPGTDYPAFADPGSAVYLDFPKLRLELDILAALQDPTDPVELTFGKLSDSIAYFRQLLEVAESNIETHGKPFKDTGTDGQKVIGIDTPWAKKFSLFGLATDKVCPN